MSTSLSYDSNLSWQDLFMVICWSLWCWRNKENFGPNYKRPPRPHEVILNQIHEIHLAMAKHHISGPLKLRTEVHISWRAPPFGWCKLNTDGTSKGNSGPAGCGGLIRNDNGKWKMENGKWLIGFSYNIGICLSFRAELWGILAGLLDLAWRCNAGIRHLILESVSLSIVNLLKHLFSITNHPNNLVRTISSWLSKDWYVRIVHTFREGNNRPADWLRGESLNCDFGLHIWDLPPQRFVPMLRDDEMGPLCPEL